MKTEPTHQASLDPASEPLHHQQQVEAQLRQIATSLASVVTAHTAHAVEAVHLEIEDTLAGALEGQEQSRATTERFLAQIRDSVAPLQNQWSAIDQSAGQLRLMQERMADRMEQLTEGAIRREVRDPLLKEFARIFSRFEGLACGDCISGRLRELFDDVELFFNRLGVDVVRPDPHDDFEPGFHRPLKHVATRIREDDRRVAACHQFGLKEGDRVISHALVSLFQWDPATGIQSRHCK